MLIEILHTRNQSVDVLYIVSTSTCDVQNISLSQDGGLYTTLVSTNDNEAVEGLNYHMVGMDRIYTLDLTKE